MPIFVRPVSAPRARKATPLQAAAPGRAAPQRGPLWHAIQLKAAQSASAAPSAPSRSGLPGALKTGVEQLSGLAMDDVHVHRNSPEPAKLGALAYTQGSEIHLGPGQERHLPHEAWHVVQQKQRRVRATAQLKSAGVNHCPALETEADAMGERAAAGGAPSTVGSAPAVEPRSAPAGAPLQFRLVTYRPETVPGDGPVSILHGMATALEQATASGHTTIGNLLAGYAKGEKVSFDKYPCSSKERTNHYFNALKSGSDSLKAAAAGYMIEDIVTAAVSTKPGYTAQYVVSGARPDFLIVAADSKTGKSARGVVDITSEKQGGHIFKKRFAPGRYDYAAECLYPNLSFGDDAPITLDPNSLRTARELQVTGANDFVDGHLRNTRRIVDSYNNSWEVTQVRNAASALRQSLVGMLRRDLSADICAPVDAQIVKFGRLTGNRLDRPTAIIASARLKYGLQGYPRDWTAPAQTATPLTVDAPSTSSSSDKTTTTMTTTTTTTTTNTNTNTNTVSTMQATPTQITLSSPSSSAPKMTSSSTSTVEPQSSSLNSLSTPMNFSFSNDLTSSSSSFSLPQTVEPSAPTSYGPIRSRVPRTKVRSTSPYPAPTGRPVAPPTPSQTQSTSTTWNPSSFSFSFNAPTPLPTSFPSSLSSSSLQTFGPQQQQQQLQSQLPSPSQPQLLSPSQSQQKPTSSLQSKPPSS